MRSSSLFDLDDCQSFTTMPVQDLHAIALASCEAARILHAKGLVHRDLRFANIIELARRGERG